MSTSTQQQVQAYRSAAEQPLRPAIREAMQRIALIAAGDTTAVITESAVTCANYGERTTISVEPVDIQIFDGTRLTEIIEIRTPLTKFKLFDEERYSKLNMFTTTGAIVRDAEGKDAVVSRVYLYEGYDAALNGLYVPLITNVALAQVVGVYYGFARNQGEEDAVTPAKVGLADWDAPSAWGPDEFAEAEERLRERGVYANASETGLAAEFPWEPGAMTAALGESTSLLRLSTRQPHPWAGNGLFTRLDLPLSFASEEEGWLAACRLNHAEVEGFDLPPFIGSWCYVPWDDTLTFASFWPNQLYLPGTAANIAFWSWSRTLFARRFVGMV